MAVYSAVEDGAIYFRPPELSDLDAIHALEAANYPEDEAATRDKLEFRIKEAPNVFLVATTSGGGGSSDEIVGYVCGTCSGASSLTHESMAVHEPGGSLLCIHSVLLKAYLPYVKGTTPGLKEVRLICKEAMVPLYQGAGFNLLGRSPVVHGQDPWLEMVHELE